MIGVLTPDGSIVDRLIEFDPDNGDTRIIAAPGVLAWIAAAPGAVDMPTMDLSTVGRTRDEEQAILEELSDSRPTGGTDRRWLLAIAGVAAVICLGFVSNSVAPPSVRNAYPGDDRAVASDAPRLALGDDPRNSTPPSQRAIELRLPADGASVTGGLVQVRLHSSSQVKIHVSVSIGDAIIGWRDVKTESDGSWEGAVRVFAPRIALPATVSVAALLPQGPIEASGAIVLEGGGQVVLWDASIVAATNQMPTVGYRASAPLDVARVRAWVTDDTGMTLGQAMASSHVEEWQAGSAGGRELGLGTISGEIPLRGWIAGRVVLHLAWDDPVTGAPQGLERDIEATGTQP